MRGSRWSIVLSMLLAASALAREPMAPERIRFIHMGGEDCPTCVAWRQFELPKLRNSPAFRRIAYSYVVKTVHSPVPPAVFLPDALKPLKDKLDVASGGRSGSPHQAIVVDDEVFDYWFGDKSAERIEAAVAALIDGTRYPHRRCINRQGGPGRGCDMEPRSSR